MGDDADALGVHQACITFLSAGASWPWFQDKTWRSDDAFPRASLLWITQATVSLLATLVCVIAYLYLKRQSASIPEAAAFRGDLERPQPSLHRSRRYRLGSSAPAATVLCRPHLIAAQRFVTYRRVCTLLMVMIILNLLRCIALSLQTWAISPLPELWRSSRDSAAPAPAAVSTITATIASPLVTVVATVAVAAVIAALIVLLASADSAALVGDDASNRTATASAADGAVSAQSRADDSAEETGSDVAAGGSPLVLSEAACGFVLAPASGDSSPSSISGAGVEKDVNGYKGLILVSPTAAASAPALHQANGRQRVCCSSRCGLAAAMTLLVCGIVAAGAAMIWAEAMHPTPPASGADSNPTSAAATVTAAVLAALPFAVVDAGTPFILFIIGIIVSALALWLAAAAGEWALARALAPRQRRERGPADEEDERQGRRSRVTVRRGGYGSLDDDDEHGNNGNGGGGLGAITGPSTSAAGVANGFVTPRGSPRRYGGAGPSGGGAGGPRSPRGGHSRPRPAIASPRRRGNSLQNKYQQQFLTHQHQYLLHGQGKGSGDGSTPLAITPHAATVTAAPAVTAAAAGDDPCTGSGACVGSGRWVSPLSPLSPPCQLSPACSPIGTAAAVAPGAAGNAPASAASASMSTSTYLAVPSASAVTQGNASSRARAGLRGSGSGLRGSALASSVPASAHSTLRMLAPESPHIPPALSSSPSHQYPFQPQPPPALYGVPPPSHYEATPRADAYYNSRHVRSTAELAAAASSSSASPGAQQQGQQGRHSRRGHTYPAAFNRYGEDSENVDTALRADPSSLGARTLAPQHGQGGFRGSSGSGSGGVGGDKSSKTAAPSNATHTATSARGDSGKDTTGARVGYRFPSPLDTGAHAHTAATASAGAATGVEWDHYDGTDENAPPTRANARAHPAHVPSSRSPHLLSRSIGTGVLAAAAATAGGPGRGLGSPSTPTIPISMGGSSGGASPRWSGRRGDAARGTRHRPKPLTSLPVQSLGTLPSLSPRFVHQQQHQQHAAQQQQQWWSGSPAGSPLASPLPSPGLSSRGPSPTVSPAASPVASPARMSLHPSGHRMPPPLVLPKSSMPSISEVALLIDSPVGSPMPSPRGSPTVTPRGSPQRQAPSDIGSPKGASTPVGMPLAQSLPLQQLPQLLLPSLAVSPPAYAFAHAHVIAAAAAASRADEVNKPASPSRSSLLSVSTPTTAPIPAAEAAVTPIPLTAAAAVAVASKPFALLPPLPALAHSLAAAAAASRCPTAASSARVLLEALAAAEERPRRLKRRLFLPLAAAHVVAAAAVVVSTVMTGAVSPVALFAGTGIADAVGVSASESVHVCTLAHWPLEVVALSLASILLPFAAAIAAFAAARSLPVPTVTASSATANSLGSDGKCAAGPIPLAASNAAAAAEDLLWTAPPAAAVAAIAAANAAQRARAWLSSTSSTSSTSGDNGGLPGADGYGTSGSSSMLGNGRGYAGRGGAMSVPQSPIPGLPVRPWLAITLPGDGDSTSSSSGPDSESGSGGEGGDLDLEAVSTHGSRASRNSRGSSGRRSSGSSRRSVYDFSNLGPGFAAMVGPPQASSRSSRNGDDSGRPGLPQWHENPQWGGHEQGGLCCSACSRGASFADAASVAAVAAAPTTRDDRDQPSIADSLVAAAGFGAGPSSSSLSRHNGSGGLGNSGSLSGSGRSGDGDWYGQLFAPPSPSAHTLASAHTLSNIHAHTLHPDNPMHHNEYQFAYPHDYPYGYAADEAWGAADRAAAAASEAVAAAEAEEEELLASLGLIAPSLRWRKTTLGRGNESVLPDAFASGSRVSDAVPSDEGQPARATGQPLSYGVFVRQRSLDRAREEEVDESIAYY